MVSSRKKAAWLVACCSLVAGFEGLRQQAYKDPVGIPTICFGETKDVKMGQTKTLANCQGMLEGSLIDANRAVDGCVSVPISDNQRTAFVSFTYNVGVTGFCKSTLVKKLNGYDYQGACDELLRWKYAKGIILPGLAKRRTAERDLCLKE